MIGGGGFVDKNTDLIISGNKTFNDDVAYKYTSTFYNANKDTSSNYAFGLYQWDDRFQYTIRDSATNTYLKSAFEIEASTGLTDYTMTPTVNGTSLVLSSLIATTSQNGLMTPAMVTKLNGLSNYSLPMASSSIRGGVKIWTGTLALYDILSKNSETIYFIIE